MIELDAKSRAVKAEADSLRADRNKISKQIGAIVHRAKKREAEELKKQVTADSKRLAALEEQERDLEEKVKKDHDDNPQYH